MHSQAERGNDIKNFASRDDTRAFLEQFDLDEDTLCTLICEGDWRHVPTNWPRDRQTGGHAEFKGG